MKNILIILAVILLSIISVVYAADEIPEEAINQLKEHCFINPNGGKLLHTDQNCRSVHDKYLPLTEIEFSEELLNQYSLCSVCTFAVESQEEPAALTDPAFIISEAELNKVTAEWEMFPMCLTNLYCLLCRMKMQFRRMKSLKKQFRWQHPMVAVSQKML